MESIDVAVHHRARVSHDPVGMKISPAGALVLLLLVCRSLLPAQDDSLRAFYPLAVGNLWQYREIYGGPPALWTLTVPGDTLFPNGKRYLIMDDSRPWVGRYYNRIDSVTLNVYRSQGTWDTDHLQDSLRASPGDTLWNVWDVSAVLFEGVGVDTVFGSPVTVKHFLGMVIPTLPTYGLARGFGRSFEAANYEDPIYPRSYESRSVLQYAKIDGQESGTLLLVPAERTEPALFRLAQNFPNPFNPTTRISYSLAARSYVSLGVYDLLGREVAMLVRGIQERGEHTALWQAGDVPSGVYFYRLSDGRSVATKKMLLLR